MSYRKQLGFTAHPVDHIFLVLQFVRVEIFATAPCVRLMTAYTMDANEAQEEYEEVQTELRKKEEEVHYLSMFNCLV